MKRLFLILALSFSLANAVSINGVLASMEGSSSVSNLSLSSSAFPSLFTSSSDLSGIPSISSNVPFASSNSLASVVGPLSALVNAISTLFTGII